MGYVPYFWALVRLLTCDQGQKKIWGILSVGIQAILIPVWSKCPVQISECSTNILQSSSVTSTSFYMTRSERLRRRRNNRFPFVRTKVVGLGAVVLRDSVILFAYRENTLVGHT